MCVVAECETPYFCQGTTSKSKLSEKYDCRISGQEGFSQTFQVSKALKCDIPVMKSNKVNCEIASTAGMFLFGRCSVCQLKGNQLAVDSFTALDVYKLIFVLQYFLDKFC
jgi:hypothetical protein